MTIPPVSFYKHDSGLGDVVGGPQLSFLRFRSVTSSIRHLRIFESPLTTAKLVEESSVLDAKLGGKDPSRLHAAFGQPLRPERSRHPGPQGPPAPPPRVRAAHTVVDEAHLSPVPFS